MGRKVLVATEIIVTVLFIWAFEDAKSSNILAWMIPSLLIGLVVINNIWSTRLVSWVIFCLGFSGFLILLSAFTLRFRLESGFDSMPFYRAIIMYVLFVYIGLGQLKILGPKKFEEEGNLSEDTKNNI